MEVTSEILQRARDLLASETEEERLARWAAALRALYKPFESLRMAAAEIEQTTLPAADR